MNTMRQVMHFTKVVFIGLSFFIFTSCSSLFESSLLTPTVSLSSQWAKKVGGNTYYDVDGVKIEFDLKGNIKRQEYTDELDLINTTATNITREFSLETAVNAYSAVYKVKETLNDGTIITESTYYIGYMVDNGPMLYRTARAVKAEDLIDLESIGLDKLDKIDELKDLSIEKIENAKLRSMHMVGHKVDLVEKVPGIKMTENSWEVLKNKVFAGQFIIPVVSVNTAYDPAYTKENIEAGGGVYDPTDTKNFASITNEYGTWVYFRAGDMGRIDANYLLKTDATTGILNGDTGLTEVNTAANNFATYPFMNKGTTNNPFDGTHTLKSYVSTNHSMVYTTKDNITTFISCVFTQVYDNTSVELKYEKYRFTYLRVQIIDENTVRLIDMNYFVNIPALRSTPYYGVPKDIILTKTLDFTPAP